VTPTSPQSTPQLTTVSGRAGAAHIAFTANSRTAVRDFYSAALTAGGRPNGSPACRNELDGHFNAAVLDFDGNSVEVVYKNGPDVRDDGTVVGHSRVMTYERTVTTSYREREGSVVSKAPSVKAPSVISKAPSLARSATEPAMVSQPAPAAPAAPNNDGAAKTLVGTLLGAAAGAAVAYAMVRSERDSAKKESDFAAFMDMKNTVKAAMGQFAQAPAAEPQPPQPADPLPIAAAPSVAGSAAHRNIETESYYSASPSQARSVRQIEAAPPSYYSASSAPSQAAGQRAIEYVPAQSVAGSQARSSFSTHRSNTAPELPTAKSVASVSTARPQSVAPSRAPSAAPSRAQSVAHSTASGSRAHSVVAHSVAPSTLISSFVPDHVERRSSAGSVHSHHSSRSKARSTHSSTSRHTSSRSKVDDSPSPPPPASNAPSKQPSRAASLVNSILGRDKKSKVEEEDFIDDLDIEELTEDDDYETIVPSDSISQVGSSTHRRRHRSHRSRTDELRDEGSCVSRSTSASERSESSRHSHRSHRSHRSHKSRNDDSDSDQSTESRRKHRSRKQSVVSEGSEASTVRPIKASSKVARKDSVTDEASRYDDMFDKVQYGHGDVPVRGITPSMINAAQNNKNRTMISFALGQKMRQFE
jgi:hypothetical protein